jgi:hypothetical protein
MLSVIDGIFHADDYIPSINPSSIDTRLLRGLNSLDPDQHAHLDLNCLLFDSLGYF